MRALRINFDDTAQTRNAGITAPRKRPIFKSLGVSRRGIEDIASARQFIAWRFTRLASLETGVIQPEMPLYEPFSQNRSGWCFPIGPFTETHSPRLAQIYRENPRLSTAGPPPTEDNDEYGEKAPPPTGREEIRVFFQALHEADRLLGLCLPNDVIGDDSGRAFYSMSSMDLYRDAWPEPEETVLFEVNLIDALSSHATRWSQYHMRDVLREKWLLTPWEIEDILMMTLRVVNNRAGRFTQEDHQNMVVARALRIADDAEDCGDRKAQIAALRLVAMATGVTRAEPANPLESIVERIEEAANEPPRLPGREEE